MDKELSIGKMDKEAIKHAIKTKYLNRNHFRDG